MPLKNLLKYFLTASVVMLASCGDTNIAQDEPQEIPQDPPEQAPAADLSADGMANCYIVREPGLYKFKADNRFNQGPGLPVPPEISPVDAQLVWQSAPGLIAQVKLTDAEADPYVEFEVNRAEGNALIAVVDDKGEIAWSWHIWMPAVTITSVEASSGYEIMNVNLGALTDEPGNPLAYGMLYQWGRKDPLPASATLTGDTSTKGAPIYDIHGNKVEITNSSWTSTADNTLVYATAHPTVCLSNYAQYATSRDWLAVDASDDTLWGNPDGDYRDPVTNTYPNSGAKTCYDPSPAGWRVAPVDAFRHFTLSGGYAWTFSDFNIVDFNNDGTIDIDDYNYGWHFAVNPAHSLYFPAASRFDGSYAMLMGSMSGYWGNYWSNAPANGMNGGATATLAFQTKDMAGNDMVSVSPAAASSRADAFSIRCVRDN